MSSGTSVPGPADLPNHRAALDGVDPDRGAVDVGAAGLSRETPTVMSDDGEQSHAA